MSINIIGIVGKKRHGKDTLAKFIEEALRRRNPAAGIVIAHWADPLKDEVARATGVTPGKIEANKSLFRPILQWWGAEFRRGQDEDYWIKRMGDKIKDAEGVDFMIVPDTRFLNEASTIRGYGGNLFRIVRPPRGLIAELKAWLNRDCHSSEVEQDRIEVDLTIRNNGSLEDLRATAWDIISRLYTPAQIGQPRGAK